MKSLQELFHLGKYDAVLEATANSDSPSDIFLRLQCFDMLELYEEWLIETKRSITQLLPMVPWVIEKHIAFLKQGKLTRSASLPLKAIYDTLPYINQSTEELLMEFNETLLEDPIPTTSNPVMASTLESWFKEKKYSVLFDALSEDHPLDHEAYQVLIKYLQSDLPAMIQTYILLYLQRINVANMVTFERQGLKFEVVPKDLSPLHNYPFIIDMLKEFRLVKDPSLGNIARQLFEKWIAMTYPFFVCEDPSWVLPAFQIIAHRYLQLKDLRDDLAQWLDDELHRVFIEEIQTLIENPDEQIG